MTTTSTQAPQRDWDADELRAGNARRQITAYAEQLLEDPLNPVVLTELRAWLATEADPALAAMAALRKRPATELRAQVRAAITRLDETLRGGA